MLNQQMHLNNVQFQIASSNNLMNNFPRNLSNFTHSYSITQLLLTMLKHEMESLEFILVQRLENIFAWVIRKRICLEVKYWLIETRKRNIFYLYTYSVSTINFTIVKDVKKVSFKR